jgi:hypothetical protein
MMDIVYLDRGRRDGLEVGDLLATLMQGKHRVVNGSIEVINIRESTATAVVRKSSHSVTKGDEVVGLK